MAALLFFIAFLIIFPLENNLKPLKGQEGTV